MFYKDLRTYPERYCKECWDMRMGELILGWMVVAPMQMGVKWVD